MAVITRVTDVWLPPVVDKDSASPTYNQTVRPHWCYVYDSVGNQIMQVNPKQQADFQEWIDNTDWENPGDPPATFSGEATRFSYDQHGNQIKRELPDEEFETWTYDEHGRMTGHEDFKGQNTTYVYDTLPGNGGRLLEERRFTGEPDGTPDEKTVYQYDALGRVKQVDEYEGATAVWTELTLYDPITQQVKTLSTTSGIINYEYDEVTGRHVRTWTNSNDSAYAYDEQGRLEKVIVLKLNGTVHGAWGGVSGITHNPIYTGSPLITTYTYDVVGNLDTVEQPNEVVTDYGYDTLNRLTSVVVTDDEDDKLFEQTYTLASNGLRSSVIEKRYDGDGNASSNVFSNVKISWTYDAMDRLTSETWDSDSTPGNGSDNFGVQNDDDYIDTFSFDLNSNRVKKIHDAVGSGNDETIEYDHNENDQLESEDSDVTGNDKSYTYDLNGSTLTMTVGASTTRYFWGLRNRMVGYSANDDGDYTDTGDAAYAYDSSGGRVSKTIVGTGTTYYLIDPYNFTGYSKALEESGTLGGSPARSYVYGFDVIAQKDGNGTVYLIKDGHGTTRGLTNTSAEVTEEYEFDAYYHPLNTDAQNASTQWLVPDGRSDGETGLILRGVRYGWDDRMLSRDPRTAWAGDWINANLHLYAGGNPLLYTDSSGQFLGLLGAAALWAGENLKDIGVAATQAGFIGGVASAALYVQAQYGMAMASMDNNVDRMLFYQDLETFAVNGLWAAGGFMLGGATAFLTGTLLVGAAGLMTAVGGGNSAGQGINLNMINQIKHLPDNARLTNTQITELGKNIDAVLIKSLPAKVAAGRGQDIITLLKTDPRFRFIDQVPGAIEKINNALQQHGMSL